MLTRALEKVALRSAAAAAALALAACGDSNTGPQQGGAQPPAPAPGAPAGSPLFRSNISNLTVSDVERVIAQAVQEAEARNAAAVIAIVDRVGNVLAVYRMTGAEDTLAIRRGPGATQFDFQGLDVIPRTMAAISKAVTGAYLSSGGNAFSTRTASMIVQEHFPPAPSTAGLESGPLFGVQFSQLPCSDFNTRFIAGDNFTQGPKRAPLGLSADPGGFPLYKNGVLVGGVGVAADDEYGFDTNILDTDDDLDEVIAVAAAAGFSAPDAIRAERIAVDGTSLRFSDADEDDLLTDPSAAPSLAALAGALVDVRGYFDGASNGGVKPGVAFGQPASGIRQAMAGEFSNSDIFVLNDADGDNRFPPRAGTDGARVSQPLTEAEVRAVLEEAFDVMTAARAQIRRPLDSRAQVTISVVDTNGSVLGVVRGPDAPVFGADVSLQKARTAAFFSSAVAASDLQFASPPSFDLPAGDPNTNKHPSEFVDDLRAFIPDPMALTGRFAFSDRAGGNLSRPFFPDGQLNTANGPLSLPIAQWSPFATGLQSALIFPNVIEHVLHVAAGAPDTAPACTFLPSVAGLAPLQNRLQNGIQIFPGSVPIYRGGELVGGIGVSGDGIDQDDMISFLGVHRAGERLGTINNAPNDIRADRIVIDVNGDPVRLRYINCPFTPFVGSSEQNVCQGK